MPAACVFNGLARPDQQRHSRLRAGSPDNGTIQRLALIAKLLPLNTVPKMASGLPFNLRMGSKQHHRKPHWKVGSLVASVVLAGLTLGFGPLAPHAHPTVTAQPMSIPPISLEFSYSQIGRVLEVKGLSSPKAAVMVNGDVVPAVGDDGSFAYFTPPLPEGENLLTVTVQDQHGQTITRQVHVEID